MDTGTRYFVVLSAVIMIVACNTERKRKVVLNASDSLISSHQLVLNTSELLDVNVALTGLGYDGDAIANSMNNAAAQSGGQLGFVGALIGGSIARNTAKNSAISQKNQPVQPFLSKLEQLPWSDMVNKYQSNRFEWVSDADSESQIYVSPKLRVSADYRSLEMAFLIEAKGANKKTRYQNYFHLFSRPIISRNQTVMELNSIPVEEIEERVAELFMRFDKLLYSELKRRKNLSNGAGSSIKFLTDGREIFERGILISKEDGMITYQTLRGEIKQYPLDI